MPSKSPAQARLMAGVAHNPEFAKKVGIPQTVGQEFNQADKGTGIMSNKGHMSKIESYATGGPVLGRSKSFTKSVDNSVNTRFMKMKDEFRDPDHANPAADEDQKYGKSGDGAGRGMVKPPKAASK